MPRFYIPVVLTLFLLILGACSDSDTTAGGGAAPVGGMGGAGGEPAMGGMGGMEPPPMCEHVDYTDPANFSSTAVSFSADVMPLLSNRCTGNGSNCHSTLDSSPSNGLYVAPPPSMMLTQQHADEAHARFVGGDSGRSTIPLVTAGDPAASFLLLKLEHTAPGICLPEGETCTPSCGRLMPAGNGAQPFNAAEKAIVRTWIRDGALND